MHGRGADTCTEARPGHNGALVTSAPVLCSGEAHPVNEQRFPLSHQYERHCAHKADASCPVHPGWAMPHNKASVRRIGLYHFVTRSREDFAAKISRAGGTNSQPKTWEFFERWARCAP